MRFTYAPGATPLDPDEAAELIPSHITTQGELNEWEQNNILSAEAWLSEGNRDLLNEKNLLLLHKKMFDTTWKWAGKFRKSNKNIGVDKFSIGVELKKLFDDARYQTESATYDLDEIAVRFHHRLVSIHLFPNGNGRHARMATDHFLYVNNAPHFSWGRVNLIHESDTRKQYIDALRKADRMDYSELLSFARS